MTESTGDIFGDNVEFGRAQEWTTKCTRAISRDTTSLMMAFCGEASRTGFHSDTKAEIYAGFNETKLFLGAGSQLVSLLALFLPKL